MNKIDDILCDVWKTDSSIMSAKQAILEEVLRCLPWCGHHERADMDDGGCDTNETLLEVESKIRELFK